MYAEERQQAIAELVAQNGRLSVTDLAERYEVTTETVRRDLSALERLGLVRRVHGGAVPSDTLTVIESALGERDAANTAEKDRIARAALDFLPPNGGTVLIDAGSTTSRLAALLPRDLRLTVVTHAVPDRRPARGPPPHRPPPAARTGPDHDARRGRHRDRPGAGRPPRRRGLRGHQRHHGRARPDHPGPRRGRHQAGHDRQCSSGRGPCGRDQGRRRVGTVRFATIDDVDVLVTDRGLTDLDRQSFIGAGLEVVAA